MQIPQVISSHSICTVILRSLNAQGETVEKPWSMLVRLCSVMEEILPPATLEFRDTNQDRKPDMVIHAQDQIWVFINDNGKFRPATPDDHVSV